MSDAKIQIKVGIVEFAGEGNQEWLASQFEKMLTKVPELLQIEVSAPSIKTQAVGNDPQNTSKIDLSVTNIASKIGGETGLSLIITSAAYLRFVQAKTSFSREELLHNMKLATGHYKKSYSKNLSRMLLTLIKNDTFRQTSANAYSFSASKEQELNNLLK